MMSSRPVQLMSFMLIGCLLTSCSLLRPGTRPTSRGTPVKQGAVLRDPQGRFQLTVPRDGLRQITGERGIALETRDGSHGFSVLAYAWPRKGLGDEEALKSVLRTRLGEVARNNRYGYQVLKQEPFTRQGHQGLRAHFLLLPNRGWTRRAYVCQLVAAKDVIYWMHASRVRTAQFGDINSRFVQEAERFFGEVRFAYEFRERQQAPAFAPSP